MPWTGLDAALYISLHIQYCIPDAFEMKGLRKILLVSRTAKKTNEWVLYKAGVKGEVLDTVKARKVAYYGHIMSKQGSCLEKEIMQGTMPGARRRGRHRTAWMDNIKTWTGLPEEESVRMTEDRDKWRKYVHGVDRILGSRTAKERNGSLTQPSSCSADDRNTMYPSRTEFRSR